MRINCTHCGRELTLADDKIPTTPFALTCPACQEKFQVDPAQLPTAPNPAPPAPAPAAAEPPLPLAGASSGTGFEPLPTLHPTDKALLDAICPAAAIANLSSAPTHPLAAALKFMGMREVQHFSTVTEAVEAIAESDVALLLICLEKASAPPCEPLEPLYRLPRPVRRRTFVALMAENVRTLDGQVAFFLQVNCLINAQDLRKMPLHLRRALLHHLRLYRHWDSKE